MKMFLKKLEKIFFTFVVLAILGIVLWTWASLNYVYAKGERAGYIQKFSQKGWLFKTWEGELAMVNLPGAMPEKFFFSVRKEGIPEKIQSSLGQRVVVHYNQHRGIPTRVFGETAYFATDVELVHDAVSPSPLPVQEKK